MSSRTASTSLTEYSTHTDSETGWVDELVRGIVIREPRPGRDHGLVQVRLAALLYDWAQASRADVTTEAGFVLALDPPTVRGPDVAVVLDPASAEVGTAGWIVGAPDLAVETVSPHDTATSIHQKVQDYLGAGTRRVWVVDPRAASVTVFRPDGSAQVLGGRDELTGEGVLEGFRIGVGEILG